MTSSPSVRMNVAWRLPCVPCPMTTMRRPDDSNPSHTGHCRSGARRRISSIPTMSGLSTVYFLTARNPSCSAKAAELRGARHFLAGLPFAQRGPCANPLRLGTVRLPSPLRMVRRMQRTEVVVQRSCNALLRATPTGHTLRMAKGSAYNETMQPIIPWEEYKVICNDEPSISLGGARSSFTFSRKLRRSSTPSCAVTCMRHSASMSGAAARLSSQDAAVVANWRKAILAVATEEMTHLLLVANLAMAAGRIFR